MAATGPTDVRDPGTPVLPEGPKERPGAPTPPAGLPLPPGAPGAPPLGTTGGEIVEMTRAGTERRHLAHQADPRPFLVRHEESILRAVAVILVIIFLLLLWQGVAYGLGVA